MSVRQCAERNVPIAFFSLPPTTLNTKDNVSECKFQVAFFRFTSAEVNLT